MSKNSRFIPHKPRRPVENYDSKPIQLDPNQSPQAIVNYKKFINSECGKLFNLLDVSNPDLKIAVNNKVKTDLSDADVTALIGSRSMNEITKFRSSMANEYMKKQSIIEQSGILCCSYIETTFSKHMQSRVINLDEYLEKKNAGDPYMLLQWIFSTFIHKSDKSTYLDILLKAHKEFTNIIQQQSEDISTFNARFDIILNHYLRSRYNYIHLQLKKDSNNNEPTFNNGSLSVFDTLSLRKITPVAVPVNDAQDLPFIPGWNPANTTDHFLNNAILVSHYINAINTRHSEATTAFRNDSRDSMKYTDLGLAKEYVIGYVSLQRPSLSKPHVAYSTNYEGNKEFKCYCCGSTDHAAYSCPKRFQNKNKDIPIKQDSVTITDSNHIEPPYKKKKKFIKKEKK